MRKIGKFRFRRDLVWVAVMAMVVASGITFGVGSLRTATGPATASYFTPSEAKLPSTIRVATFNIHGGRDAAGKDDLSLTARTLEGFDFIGLQEVTKPFFKDNQAQELGRILGMAAEFLPSERQYWRDCFGNGMLTKLPVHSWERRPLLALDEDSRRNATIVKLGKKQVTVIVTHIARHEDQYDQLKQVSKIFLAEPGPCVLMGDMNANSQYPLLRELLGAEGVISAVDFKHPDLADDKRVDWIFVRNMEVIDAGIKDLGASDHPLVWAELKVIE